MSKQSYAAAFVDALADSMRDDATVSLIGSTPLGLGPQRGLTDRIHNEFPERVIDPPTAEGGVALVGAGAAMAGVRPFVDLLTGSFVYLAWMSIANEAANGHFMSGGKLTVPVTYHCLEGVRGAGAPQHSQSPHAMLWNAPGVELVVPSTAADVYGLVRTAIMSPNPTVIFSHAKILGIEWEVPTSRGPIPFGKADVKRRGRDVSIIATSITVHHALAAAAQLAAEGIEAEVVDPRTLVPFDEATILESVRKTGRAVVVDEAPLRCGAASEIAATIGELAFKDLKAPVARVARADAPVPFSPPLEDAVTPGVKDIVSAVQRMLDDRSEPRGAVEA
jgi:acetoin:2,6-dichlorophenolindophenol oxidoreductase subunit beta